jgi:hypothetical protein
MAAMPYLTTKTRYMRVSEEKEAGRKFSFPLPQ